MKSLVILFSGGIDSVYTAGKLAYFYDKVILNTYKVPGMKNINASKKSYLQIKKIHGKKIVHNILDISDFVKQIRGNIPECIKDNIKYRFFYSWCLGCKLSMHLYTVKYCLKNNIKFAADGSNYYDLHALEQNKSIKEIFKKIYDNNGIKFITPFYREKNVKISKGIVKTVFKHLRMLQDNQKGRLNYLNKKNIYTGIGILGQHRAIQPSCITSLFFNIPRLFLKPFLKNEEKKGQNYIKQKLCCLTDKQKGIFL